MDVAPFRQNGQDCDNRIIVRVCDAARLKAFLSASTPDRWVSGAVTTGVEPGPRQVAARQQHGGDDYQLERGRAPSQDVVSDDAGHHLREEQDQQNEGAREAKDREAEPAASRPADASRAVRLHDADGEEQRCSRHEPRLQRVEQRAHRQHAERAGESQRHAAGEDRQRTCRRREGE